MTYELDAITMAVIGGTSLSGGVGSIVGTLVGGLIVGVAEELSVLVLPSEYKAAMAFAILLFMLLVRPTGLLRGKVL